MTSGHALGQILVSDSTWLDEKATTVSGGSIQAGQIVFGLPWHEFSMGVWRRNDDSEWSVGCQTSGNLVWRETSGWFGFDKTVNPQHRATVVFDLGWVSWPEVRKRVAFMDMRGQVSHRETWGQFQFEALATVGLGQRISGLTENGLVRTSNGHFGWAVWWRPNLIREFVGLPALGWAHGGRWQVAWGLDSGWWERMRPWRPLPGRVFLRWSWPEGQFEMSWTGTLGPISRSKNENTQRVGLAEALRRNAFGVFLRRGSGLQGGRWWWVWERGDLDLK